MPHCLHISFQGGGSVCFDPKLWGTYSTSLNPYLCQLGCKTLSFLETDGRNFPPPFLHLWLSQNSSVTRVPSLPRLQVCECLLLTSSTPRFPFLCFVGVEQWAKCIKTKTYLCRELYNLKHFTREFKMVDIPQQGLRNWEVCMYVVSFLAFSFSKLTTQHTLLL